MTAEAGMLLKPEMTTAAETTAASWMSSAIDRHSREDRIFSRDTSNSRRNSRLEN
jgi:hypothetical protein